MVLVLVEEADVPVQDVAERGLRVRPQLAYDLVERLLDQDLRLLVDELKHVLLRAEVVEERANGQARRLGNLAHARGVIAVSAEELQHGGGELPPPRFHQGGILDRRNG